MESTGTVYFRDFFLIPSRSVISDPGLPGFGGSIPGISGIFLKRNVKK